MTEDRRADWSGQKADRVDTKCFQCADERISARKKDAGKYQTGDGAVEEEVVPFNRRPDCGSQHRAAQLPPMLRVADTARLVTDGHVASLGPASEVTRAIVQSDSRRDLSETRAFELCERPDGSSRSVGR